MNARLTLIALVASVALVSACSGSDGAAVGNVPLTPVAVEPVVEAQQMGFSEQDLSEDRAERLDPGETAALFLEGPGQVDPEFDTGTDGTDLVPLTLPGDGPVTLVLDEGIQQAILRDSQGAVVLQADAGAPEVSADVPAGDYTLELTGRHPEGSFEFLTFSFGDSEARIRLDEDSPGADLTGSDLSGEVLFSKDLTGAKLVRCGLTKTHFQSCLFTGADFTGCQMDGAEFPFCTLTRAKFERCFGDKVLFRSTKDISEASFNRSVFPLADFTNAKVSGKPPTFRDTELSGANFALTTLSGADFTRAILESAHMTGGTNFDRAIFLGARIAGANFTSVPLSEAVWVDGRILPVGQQGPPTN